MNTLERVISELRFGLSVWFEFDLSGVQYEVSEKIEVSDFPN
jgi:hypothetical protein